MSLDLAQTWVRASLRSPRACKEVAQFFEQAAATGQEATLLVAPEVTVAKKGLFVRWTGDELVVVELSPHHQQRFGVVPAGVFPQFESKSDMAELPPRRDVTLSDVRIDDSDSFDPRKPLSGRVAFELGDPWLVRLRGCALHAQYFHPGLVRPITTTSYIDHAIGDLRGDLPFSMNPIMSELNPTVPCKSLVLMFRLYTARDWIKRDGIQCVSNIATGIVDLQ